jgi:hypothetical protein
VAEESSGQGKYTVPCPRCGATNTIGGKRTETRRRACPGCGNVLVMVWTETAFLVTSEWAQREHESSDPEEPAPRPAPPEPRREPPLWPASDRETHLGLITGGRGPHLGVRGRRPAVTH